MTQQKKVRKPGANINPIQLDDLLPRDNVAGGKSTVTFGVVRGETVEPHDRRSRRFR